MKLKTLLLCGGLLTAMSASAALDITERTAPVLDWASLPTLPAPAKSDLVTDGATIQYFYNPGLQAYFAGGNNWQTRATALVEKGVQITVAETGSGTYSITNYVGKFSEWRKAFAGGPTDVWTDNNTGANCDAWSFTVNADGTFTIANEPAAAGAVLGGVAGDLGELGASGTTDVGTYLNLYPAETANFHYTWYAVSEDAYATNLVERETLAAEYATKRDAMLTEYESLSAIYKSASALYAALMKADELGVTGLDEYVAVYKNAESTVEQLDAATKAVEEAIVAAESSNASVAKPADVSSVIVNRTFDTVGDFHGWSGNSWGAGGTTGPCAERYNMTFDTWQEIKDLKNGVYALSCTAFYRAGNTATSFTNYQAGTGKNAFLYAANMKADAAANDTLTSVVMNMFDGIVPNETKATSFMEWANGDDTYYVPNTMMDAVNFFENGYYTDNRVLFAITEGTAKIGMYKKVGIGEDWVLVDNFALTYYGDGADAYQLWYTDLLKNVASYSAEDQITESVLESYNTTVDAAKGATVSNYDEVMTNHKSILAAQKAIEENIAAWKSYIEAFLNAQKVAANQEMAGPAMDALNDYLFDVETFIEEKQLTTEELIKGTADMIQLTSDAIQNSIKPGTEYDQLKNVDFADGFNNWTVEAVSGGNVAADQTAKCAEAFNNANFDIYQEIKDAPVGCYEITLQGFYRRGRGDAAWRYYFEDTGEKKANIPEVPVYVYMNDNKTPISYVYDYQVAYSEDADGAENHLYAGTDYQKDPNGEYVYPNSMASAGKAFDKGAYKMSAFGLVAKKGDALRVGVKGSANQDNDSWPIFTRFKLVYQGYEATIVGPKLKEAIDAIDLTKPMGVDIKAKASELKTAGEAAYATNDGKTMFDALAAIYHYNDSISESVALFTELTTAIEALLEFAPEAPNAAIKESAINYAEGLKTSMATFTNKDAEEAMVKLAELTTQLAWPEDYTSASDAQGSDFTGVLKSPSFEKEGTNSIEGWTAEGYNFGNDDTQKAALALEYYQKDFDMHQTVSVPNGMYMVTIKGFTKDTSTDAQGNYDKWVAGTPNGAMLYAVSANDTTSVDLENIAAVPSCSMEDFSSENQKFTHDGNDYFVPNSMVGFITFTDNDASKYLNSLNIKVTDGKLTIGISGTKAEWVIMDNVTLTYFGENSAKEETGWTTEIESVNAAAPAKVEIYQLTGAKAATMKKGFNIIRTIDANGNVKVQKVIVR